MPPAAPAVPTDSPDLIAIVAGGTDFGEADRIVHFLTRHGAVSAFAHGARKSRRRFAGALEPFSTVRLRLDRRRRRGLPTLSSSVVETPRLPIRTDLERIAVAAYVVELAVAVSPEEDPSDGVFELVEQALDALVAAPATLPLRRAFELRMVSTLGFAPVLDRCVVCGVDAGEVEHLDLHRGGVVCMAHARGAPRIGPKTRQWVAGVLAAETLEPAPGVDAQWAQTAAERLAAATGAFYSVLLGRTLKSTSMLFEVGL